MASLQHELFLLMLHLSRMRDRRLMIQIFVDALAAANPRTTLRLLATGEQSDGEVVEIATASEGFGHIAIEGADALAPDERAMYRNAIAMLAVVLENASRENRLATENARLDAAVAARTASLQQALASLQRALAESDDLYQNAPCGYHSLGPDGTYVRINDTELRWLGRTREEVIGKLRFADLLAPEGCQAFPRLFERLKERGSVENIELVLLRKDGSELPVVLSATAIRGADGQFHMCRSIVLDISDRRRIERELRESEERFRQAQKLEAIGRLAGGVAHDFNNLLTVILSCADLVHEALPAADPLRVEVKEIGDAGRRAAQLTRQLLAFGRRQATTPVPLDVGEIVARMEPLLRRLIGEEVALEVERGEALGLVRADAGQIEQVILNLAVNARDAMPAGGRLFVGTKNLEVAEQGCRGVAPGSYVALTVRDTGTGMSPETRVRIFEPFFTTKAKDKGTGLGLATVYGIVKQSGGDIRVESAPGTGSSFEVFLPRIVEHASAAPPPVTGAEVVPAGSEVVLLVEDEPSVRAVSVRALRAAGYTVLEAADGEEGLALGTAVPALDVLVTDVVMPRVRGPQLAASLRARRKGLRVLFVSGYAEESLFRGELPDAGILWKPFTPAALARAIRAMVDKGRSEADPAVDPATASGPPKL